jgi:hypothetical protein
VSGSVLILTFLSFAPILDYLCGFHTTTGTETGTILLKFLRNSGLTLQSVIRSEMHECGNEEKDISVSQKRRVSIWVSRFVIAIFKTVIVNRRTRLTLSILFIIFDFILKKIS